MKKPVARGGLAAGRSWRRCSMNGEPLRGARHARARPTRTRRRVERAHRRDAGARRRSRRGRRACCCARRPARMQPRLDAGARARRGSGAQARASWSKGLAPRDRRGARGTRRAPRARCATDTTRIRSRAARWCERKLLSRLGASTRRVLARDACARRTRRRRGRGCACCCEGTRAEQVAQARGGGRRRAGRAGRTRDRSRRATSVRAPRPGLVEALPYKLGERPPAGRAARRPAGRRHALRARLRARAAAVAVRAGHAGRGHRRRRSRSRSAGHVRYVSARGRRSRPTTRSRRRIARRLSYLAEITLDERRGRGPAGRRAGAGARAGRGGR